MIEDDFLMCLISSNGEQATIIRLNEGQFL